MNRLVAGMLAEYFSDIWVSGEISNLRAYPSGHLYFVLKDKESQIDAVCFRSAAASLKFKLEDGLEVVAHGRVEIYAPRGKYQLVLDRFEPKGLGALQKAFEQLKKKLEQEGLFRPERKRPLPAMPRVIGIVTSPAGAAVRDMVKTLRLHKAKSKVLLYPAQVQGEGAAAQVAEGIMELSKLEEVEVIIVGRGGGSIEDLWSFNEEVVARAIAASRVPVVSGVGHETDFTIADFVADVRAATPTAAAQLVAKGWEEAEDRLKQGWTQLVESMDEMILDREQRLSDMVRHRAFEIVRGRLAEAGHRIAAQVMQAEARAKEQLRLVSETFGLLTERLARQRPTEVLLRRRADLADLAARLTRKAELVLEHGQGRLALASGRLNAYSPLASLERGYAICLKPDGVLVKSVGQVEAGERVEVRVSDGEIDCQVLESRQESGGS